MTSESPTADEFAEVFESLFENKDFLKRTMNTTARTTKGERDEK